MNVMTSKIAVQDKKDLDGVFLEKFVLVERFFQMRDHLYKQLLAIWTPSLEEEVVAWAKWLAPSTLGKDNHAGTASDSRAE
jgi:hypothetical protein